MYTAEWFLNYKLLNTDQPALSFYSHECAINDAEAYHPEDGKHYSQKDGIPQMKVCVSEIHSVPHNSNSLVLNYRLFRRPPCAPKITPLTQC